MWDVWYVICLGIGMLGMWNFRDVGCLESEMFGMLEMWDI